MIKPIENIERKILDKQRLQTMLNIWDMKERKIVFTNGCFDVLHYGHIHYLSEAKSFGDVLIIGLNTDQSVSQLKGKDRPINGEYYRAIQLAAMQFIDAVVYFSEDTPQKLIELIRPQVLVKGGDYKKEDIVGADFVESIGGCIEIIPFVSGFSSSKIINLLNE